MDAGFVEAVEQSSQGSAGRRSAPGGGGVALPLTWGPPVPSNVHGCYLYIFIHEYMYMQVLPATPPPNMGNLKDMWGAPPPICRVCNGHDVRFRNLFFCTLFNSWCRVDCSGWSESCRIREFALLHPCTLTGTNHRMFQTKKRYKRMEMAKFAQIPVKVVRISYEVNVNVTKCSHVVHGDGRNLRYNPPHFHRVCTTHHGAW